GALRVAVRAGLSSSCQGGGKLIERLYRRHGMARPGRSRRKFGNENVDIAEHGAAALLDDTEDGVIKRIIMERQTGPTGDEPKRFYAERREIHIEKFKVTDLDRAGCVDHCYPETFRE